MYEGTQNTVIRLCKTGHIVPCGSPEHQVLDTSEECIKLDIPTVVTFKHN